MSEEEEEHIEYIVDRCLQDIEKKIQHQTLELYRLEKLILDVEKELTINIKNWSNSCTN